MSGPHAFLDGRLRLHQAPRGAHRAGTDAVLLARLMDPAPGARVCDVGAGTGAVGLMRAALTPGLTVALVERDPGLAALARLNALENGLPAVVIEADVLAPAPVRRAAGLEPGAFDLVLTNPPFLEAGRHRPSPDPGRAAAHGLAAGGLDAWVRACAALLRPGGRLGLVHRADALSACLAALRGFGGLVLRPVHPRADAPAIRLLIAATKGSRAAATLLPALVLHGADGRFTPEAEALHRGAAWPPRAPSPAAPGLAPAAGAVNAEGPDSG